MFPQLYQIPGISDENPVRIRALAFDGRSEVLKQLSNWSTSRHDSEKSDYKKIIKAMRIRASVSRQQHVNERLVSKCATYDEVYEFRAHKGAARVMFFWLDSSLIVCTNTHSKDQDANQDASFKRCYQMRTACMKCDLPRLINSA